MGITRLRLWYALNAAHRLTPTLAVADDAAIPHDESAAHEGVRRQANDIHALKRRDLAAGRKSIRGNRILTIEIDEGNVRVGARQKRPFCRIEPERLGRPRRRQAHIIAK